MERTRLEEMVQAQLDGELSAADRAELARHLLKDAEARRLHDEYLRVDRLLRDIPAAEPPAGLREAILAGASRADLPGEARDARRWMPLPRIAAAVAGGLLIVGLAYLVSDEPTPGVELQGSLQAGGGPDLPAAAGEFRVSLQAEGITVDATLHREGSVIRLELHSAADIPVEVAVRFDPATTSFAGGAPDASLASGGGEIVVRLPAGRESATLDFSGRAPFQLELRAGGRVLQTAGFGVTLP